MNNQTAQVRASISAGHTRRFVFVLLDNFTMLCFSCAVEALRIANRMSGEKLYEWTLFGEGGDTITCSAGTAFKLDSDLAELNRDLCDRIRSGEMTPETPGLLAHLKTTTMAQVEVDQPRYSGLKTAKEKSPTI